MKNFKQKELIISKRDSQIFFDGIIHPKKPSEILKKAVLDREQLNELIKRKNPE